MSERDVKLADRLVEAGIGSEWGGYYSPFGSGFLSQVQKAPAWFASTNRTAYDFVRDGRVVLAAMNEVKGVSCEAWVQLMRSLMHTYHEAESGPAILIACLETLEKFDGAD